MLNRETIIPPYYASQTTFSPYAHDTREMYIFLLLSVRVSSMFNNLGDELELRYCWFGDQVPTMVPTKCPPSANQMPTKYQQSTNQVPIKDQPNADQVPTKYQSNTNQVPT